MEIILNKTKIHMLRLGLKCLVNELNAMKEALNDRDINPIPNPDVEACINEQIEVAESIYEPLFFMAQAENPIQIETCPTKHPINHG